MRLPFDPQLSFRSGLVVVSQHFSNTCSSHDTLRRVRLEVMARFMSLHFTPPRSCAYLSHVRLCSPV